MKVFTESGRVRWGPQAAWSFDLWSRCPYTGDNLLRAAWAEEFPTCFLPKVPWDWNQLPPNEWYFLLEAGTCHVGLKAASLLPHLLRGSLSPQTHTMARAGPLHPCPIPTWTAQPSTSTSIFFISSILFAKSKEQHI